MKKEGLNIDSILESINKETSSGTLLTESEISGKEEKSELENLLENEFNAIFMDKETTKNNIDLNKANDKFDSEINDLLENLDFNEDEPEIDDLSEGIDYSIDIEIQMLEEDFFELEKEFSDYTKLEEKNIIKLDNKTEKHREIIKASIKLAFQKKDPLSVKYRKAANQKRSLADKIYAKYGAIARTLVNK
jgi:hypothetical protein